MRCNEYFDEGAVAMFIIWRSNELWTRSRNIVMAFADVADIGYLCFYRVLLERFRDLRENRFQSRPEKPKFRAVPLQFRLISGCFAPRRSMLWKTIFISFATVNIYTFLERSFVLRRNEAVWRKRTWTEPIFSTKQLLKITNYQCKDKEISSPKFSKNTTALEVFFKRSQHLLEAFILLTV